MGRTVSCAEYADTRQRKGKEEWPVSIIHKFSRVTSVNCGHLVDSVATRGVVREESSRYDINSHVKLFRK